MTAMEAIELFRQGHTVRRAAWGARFTISLEFWGAVYPSEECLDMDDLIADDWEIVTVRPM